MDRPKKRASLKSFKLVIPATIILLVVLALAGQAAFASIGNQSPNDLILPAVYFTDPVPNINPNLPNESCIIGIFGGPDDIALEHEWWLYYRGTGTHTVNLNVWATSVNPSEAGEITVDFVDDSGAQSLTVVHPSGGQDMGTLSLSVTGGTPYSFTVSKNATVGVAHHYRLGTDNRATELGWGGVDDWLYYMESGRNDWAFHASPQPQEPNAVEISIMIDGSGIGEVPNQAQNITYAVVDAATMTDVISQTTQAISPGSPITIAFSVSAGTSNFILKIDGDGHYRMQNQSGTDWGFYLLPCPEQERHDPPRLVLVEAEDPHTDIGQMPIIMENAGNEAIIDFRIEPGAGLDNIYAGEFHFVVEGPLEVLDSRPDLPGINLETRGEGLAANGLEELNLSTVGFPNPGDVLRTCDWDPQFAGIFTAWMDSEQATTSPDDLPALGIAQMDLNDDHTELGYDIRVEIDLLSSDIIAAHFHQGLAGDPGGMVKNITFDGDTALGVWRADDSSQPLDDSRINQLFDNGLYINIHTVDFPDGEIRGQVIWNDSRYDFIKGVSGDTPSVPLQNLDQHKRDEWGDNWCGPTAAGISLGWFAEVDGEAHGDLIPDANENGQVDEDEKYDAIEMLGHWISTDPDEGTTDHNMVFGIDSYINSRGLTGAFVLKTFNSPTFMDYVNELNDGEDTLIGISYPYPDGGGHWLVGRSYTEVMNDNGTPDDPFDDYRDVSFVDPGSGSIYHSRMRLRDDAIWYNDEWVEFDIMISVSPDERNNNIDTAQIYIPVNDVYWDDDVQFGDFTFTLLGNPRPGEPFHRTAAFVADELGGISLARMHVRAIDSGIANIFLINPDGETISVLMISVDPHGDLIDDPPAVDFRHPAGIVEIDLVQIRVQLQGTRDQDYQWHVPLGIEIFQPSGGGGFPDEPLVDFFLCEQTRRDGPWAVCSIEDAPEGFFDVFVAGARTLVSVKRNVELKGMVDFQNPLREGDLNENGSVNALDFSMWLETWRDEVTPCPPEHFDDFSIGDFDKDCFVGATDFSIFLENWRHESPQEEPQ